MCEGGTAELRDLKPKCLCGSGTAGRQVAVYFLFGCETTELVLRAGYGI